MAESKTAWEQASEWFARTLAIVLVMVAPGALGAWLDGRLGTNFIAAIGFVFGMVLAIGLLMIFVRIKPIAGDSVMMKPRSTSSAGSASSTSSSSQSPVQTSRQVANQKPSESRLPEIPGAEVLEAPRDE